MYLSIDKMQNLTDGAVDTIMTALYGSEWSGTDDVTENKELMRMSEALDAKIFTIIERANNIKFEGDIYGAFKKDKRAKNAKLQTCIDFAKDYAGQMTPAEIVAKFFEEWDKADV